MVPGCNGVEFQLLLTQGARTINERRTAQDGRINFRSGEFDNVDFGQRLTVKIVVTTVPPNLDCGLAAGTVYEKTFDSGLTPVSSGPFETVYEVDLNDF